MARDPRKSSALDSGMRGREKPKASSSSGEAVAGPGKTIGDPDGVGLSAYTSGMRGAEKPKQKAASGAATQQPKAGEAGGNRQQPHSTVGKPGGHDDVGQDPGSGVSDAALRSASQAANKMGGPGENLEDAAQGNDPDSNGILGEEDDTHINIRIPKASLKRKQSGMAGTV
jgi:hypothetical protein